MPSIIFPSLPASQRANAHNKLIPYTRPNKILFTTFDVFTVDPPYLLGTIPLQYDTTKIVCQV